MARKNDNLWLIWMILSVMGIYSKDLSPKAKLTVFEKNYKAVILWIVIIISFVCSLRIIWAFKNTLPIQFTVTLTIGSISTFLTCISLFRVRMKLVTMKTFISFFKVKKRKSATFIIIHLVFLQGFVTPIMQCVIIFYRSKTILDALRFSAINDYTLQLLQSIVSAYLWLFFQISVPVTISCVCCAICYRWREIISDVCKQIPTASQTRRLKNPDAKIITDLLTKCRVILNGTKFLKELLSPILFCMSFQHFMNLFLALLTIMANIYKFFGIPKIYVFIIFSYYCLFFSGNVLIGAKVAEEMENLFSALVKLDENLTFDCQIGTAQAKMKHLLKRKPIYFTVGQCIEIKRSLILTTFGTLLTYGLLVINLK